MGGTTLVLVAFWLLYALAAASPTRWSVYLFFAMLPFGALSVIPTAATGGTTILPVIVCSALLVVKVFGDYRHRSTLIDGLFGLKRLGMLTGFVLVALIVTATSPQIFSGTPVMGLNTGLVVPLAYGTGNLTQSLYLSSSFLITASFYCLLVDPDNRPVVARALLLGGAMVVISGLADMVTAGTAILEPLRTASYTFLVNDSIGNMRRVVGFETEASSFGGLSLAFAAILYFVRPAALLGANARLLQHGLAIACLAMAVLSTSSAAYVGLAVFVLCAFADVVRRAILRPDPEDRRTLTGDVVVLGIFTLAAGMVVLLSPGVWSAIYGMFDTVVLQKSQTSSYVERGTWNSVSLEGLWQTGGYGVGIGSTRASNWMIAVMTSTGLLGASLMFGFLAFALFAPVPRGDPALRAMCLGSRIALIIILVPALGVGTLVDFGPCNALIFASLAALRVAIAPAAWMQQASQSTPGRTRRAVALRA
jgi:hypothetical protein